MARDVLLTDHGLEVPLRYLIVVEGTTDVRYLECAGKRFAQKTGCDLLGLGQTIDGTDRITLCTPFNPRAEGKRGGTPQVLRLADDLKQYVNRFEVVGPICFVLDHDKEGREAEGTIRKAHKYCSDRAKAITIDPNSHPRACCFNGKGERPVVIEDLLSLQIQLTFFERSRPSCEVDYLDGSISRIAWREPSKCQLCDFVCSEATAEDLVELARVLLRVRQLWRLDIPEAVTALVSEPPEDLAMANC